MIGYRNGELFVYCEWCWAGEALPDQEDIRTLPKGWAERSSALIRAHACPKHRRRRVVPNSPEDRRA